MFTFNPAQDNLSLNFKKYATRSLYTSEKALLGYILSIYT